MTGVIVTIEKLAGLGDGMGFHEGRKIFVPYTLPGDTVMAHIIRSTTDATYARLTEIITPAAQRVAAPCPHFTQCGGCSLQHMPAAMYQQFKQDMALEAVRKAGYNPSVISAMHSCPPHSRRRAQFTLRDGQLGYFQERSHDIVPLDDCMLLEPELQALVWECRKDWIQYPFANTIQINAVDDGYDVMMAVTRFTNAALPHHPRIRRMSVTLSGEKQTLWIEGEVRLTIGNIRAHIPAGAFLQATREAQDVLSQHATRWVQETSQVHDLFCGIGTYGLRLAEKQPVQFWESESSMVDALNQTLQEHKITRAKAAKRDLFASPLPASHFNAQDGVIINPPRIGAKAQCTELAQSRATKIAMISCNPATFTRDAIILRKGGYQLHKVIPVDQFTYSAHLELVGLFTR